ncbi:fucolectin-3-like [Lineus longissimus]|uniref:fucolectin-3-like n=1 Tax=Lineus longissimus TaxID=88925 RepID=UPI00315C9A5E
MRENRSLNRPAYQISDAYKDNGFAKSVVDGKKESSYHKGRTCSHTKSEKSASWWYVDLGEPLPISTVEIVNRGDSLGNRLNNFELFIGNTKPPTGFGSAFRCYKASQAVKNGQIFTIPCNDMTGRFVMIRIPHGILSLCEVTVYVPCMSSTTTYFEMVADAAAPNNTEPLLTRQARSLIECALLCAEQKGCETFFYFEETRLGQLWRKCVEMPFGGRGLSYKRKP